MRMVRSSGERTRDVKRRSARRGGSIPPRAKQQEKSIFCNKHVFPLETVQYSPQKGGRRAGKFTLTARKDEQKTNNNRLKRFGQRTFFLAAGKTANKRRFTDGLPPGKTAALMASMEGIARVQHPPYSSRFLPFLPFSCRLTRSTLPTRPVRIRGLPQFYFQKGEPHARLLKNFPGV